MSSTVGTSQRRANTELRPEIQGLRALAVALVLLYHLWPGRLPGGFIGVDVFFVISGFLIIGHLLREAAQSGRVRLGRFWMRRARRILPLALLVLAVTAIATATIAPLGLRQQYFEEVLAAVFFAENWRLAADSVDYLRADYEASPVQQYWSLGVEEQFYIALPLIIVALLAIAATLKVGRVRLIGAVLIVLALASLVMSVIVTAQASGVAYFGTHTRLWQFLLGGLLALVALARPRMVVVGPRAAHLLATVGAALIVGSAVFLSGQTPFPGWIAVVPVLGTLAIIVSGPEGWFGRLSAIPIGSTRPVLWLGAISYGVYLWHWPIIVFAELLLGPLNAPVKLVIIAATLTLATATKRWVEDPLRFARWKGAARWEPFAVATAALAAMLLVSGGSAAGWADADRRIAALEQAERIPVEEPCFGAAALAYPEECADTEYAMLHPSLDLLRSDDANREECWSRDVVEPLSLCELGQREGATLRVLAVGDSYNGALLEAYGIAGDINGWAVDVTSRRSCPWGVSESGSIWNDGCIEWGALVEQRVSRGDYDLVITTASRRNAAPELQQTLVDLWQRQAERGVSVIAVESPPRGISDYLKCVRGPDAEVDVIAACSQPRELSYRSETVFPGVESRVDGSGIVDLNDLICPSDLCSPVVGGAYVYRDGGHLSQTFSVTLAPFLAERLAAEYSETRAELSSVGATRDAAQ